MDERMQAVAEVMPYLVRQEVVRIGPVLITSTVINTWIIMLLLFVFLFAITRGTFRYVPRGAQLLLEEIMGFLHTFVDQGIGKGGRRFVPIIGTYFLFILVLNVSWLIPGMIPPTTDIMTTVALAISAILMVHFVGVGELGVVEYLRHFLHPTPIMAPMHLLEELVKPFSLSIRLFGNIYGEEMVIGILFALVPLFIPIPIMALAMLMGIIQAYIFTLLTTSYLAAFTEHSAEAAPGVATGET